MDFLRQQIAQIQQQLSGLTASQRMLAVSLAAIAVMTLFWWTTFASRAEMEPLLDQSMSAEDVASITARLTSQQIPYKVEGDRVMVPAEQKLRVLGDLSLERMLPRDTRKAFDEIISKTNPFTSPRVTDAMWNEAKQSTLSQIIRQFPGVSGANVIVDPTRERGPNGVDPSATVYMSMQRGHQGDKSKVVNAAADLVCGAVANLARSRIKVIVDDMSYPVRDADLLAGSSDDWLERVQKSERYYAAKVEQMLAMVDKVLVSVSVKPNVQRVESFEKKVDKNNVVVQPLRENETSEENQTVERGTGEPGVASNAPLAIGEEGGGDSNSGTSRTSSTDYLVDTGHVETKSWNPGGELPVTSASVLLPRSYFVKIYKRSTNSASDPDAAVLQGFISAELTKMKQVVKGCFTDMPDDALHVECYTDLESEAPGLAQAAVASTSLGLVTNNVKEIALGVLALVSLFMVSSMVKKSSPAPVVAAPQVAKPTPPLPGGEEAVGEATEGNALLDGMELDEDSVRAQQMLSQVSELVGENPDAAANLVKRWLNRS